MTNHNNPVISFLNALDNSQLEKVSLPIQDLTRNTWHYLPGKMLWRAGIQIKELNEAQRDKFALMLKEYLSETGYTKTQKIIELENVLAEIESNPDFRDPEIYFIAIYGNPRIDSLWAWSFEGHHISLNFTILNDKITVSPRFFGASPATILHGERKGERTLDQEEDLAFELLNSLNESQKQKAVFQNVSFIDIVTTNATEVSPLKEVGVEAQGLDGNQQSKLKELIAVYLNSLPEKVALLRQNIINEGEFDEIRFGWAGELNKNEAHYYRIQGKTFLIEFDNTQNDANHIHTVWRDFDGDFGRDLIREHYLNSNHHEHD